MSKAAGAEVDNVEARVMKVLASGPLRTGELIEALHQDKTKWDQSPTHIVLSDMVRAKLVLWWRDETWDVCYGLPEHRGDIPCGDDSPEAVAIRVRLEDIVNRIGQPRYTKDGDPKVVTMCVNGKELEIISAGSGKVFWRGTIESGADIITKELRRALVSIEENDKQGERDG